MKPYKNLHIHYPLINDLHLPYEYYPYTSVQIILKKRQEILFISPLQIYGRQFVMSCRLIFYCVTWPEVSAFVSSWMALRDGSVRDAFLKSDIPRPHSRYATLTRLQMPSWPVAVAALFRMRLWQERFYRANFILITSGNMFKMMQSLSPGLKRRHMPEKSWNIISPPAYSDGKITETRKRGNYVYSIYPSTNLSDESDTTVMGVACILDAILHY